MMTQDLALPAGSRCAPPDPTARALLRAIGLALLLGMAALVTSPALLAQEVASAPQASTTVNINTADAETLASGLDGIGMSRAQEIVRYRESFGPFSSVDELAAVKGIGKSTLEKNRAVITLE